MDRRIGIDVVIAALGWVTAVGLWVLSLAWGGPPLRSLAIIVMGAAATLTVRAQILRCSRQMENVLKVVLGAKQHENGDVRPLR